MTDHTSERDRVAHTPGEWRVNAGFAQIDVPDRDAPICRLLWPTDLRSEAETYANARLIAAAPELLEALQEARFRWFGQGPANSPIARQMDAAIAKALSPSNGGSGE